MHLRWWSGDGDCGDEIMIGMEYSIATGVFIIGFAFAFARIHWQTCTKARDRTVVVVNRKIYSICIPYTICS